MDDELFVRRGVYTARQAVMGGDFTVRDHPVSGGSSTMVGERAGFDWDGQFSSHTVGNFLRLQASVHLSSGDFSGGRWGCLLENFESLLFGPQAAKCSRATTAVGTPTFHLLTSTYDQYEAFDVQIVIRLGYVLVHYYLDAHTHGPFEMDLTKGAVLHGRLQENTYPQQTL